jgi:cell division septation protein DedD
MSEHDQEVTLGTGRLLGLFFALVIVCALFFSLGFTFGRHSGPETVQAATADVPNSGESKPSASRREPVVIQDSQPAKPPAEELTFYKAVEQNEPKVKLEKPAPAVAPRPAETRRSGPAGSGYMVQVAAVTKQEDAEALVHALRKKNYPVMSITAPSDKLYHVQVGPFADLEDAEGAKSKLVANGYNPILKK